jgi:uncharacterized protein YaaW (UPF0174 family)
VDELRTALELATEDELRDLTEILFRPKFNPLDYVRTPNPIEVQSQDREDWLDTLDDRFRYLGADGVTVLRRQTGQVSYRQILIQVCRYLKLPYAGSMSTTDLEAEIFLSLLNRAWRQLPASEKSALTQRVQRSVSQSSLASQLPLPVQNDPLNLALKGGGAIAISSLVRPMLLQHVARQFALHFASYQIAKETLAQGGVVAATQFQNYVSMRMARHGMAVSAARYGATRTVFMVAGSAMWAWFLADLGWRSISTNYGRVIPTVFALAQIRLTRSECFEAI